MQSSIVNRQSSIVNRQSSIVNRQSSIVKNSVKIFARLSSACLISLILSETSFGVNCDEITTIATASGAGCDCMSELTAISTNERDTTTGARTENYGIKECTDDSDIVCEFDITIGTISIASPQYFKNITADATDYFKCDWNSGSGFSNGATYIPTPPPPPAIRASILNFNQPAVIYSEEINVTE